ncbi:hypothetical protein EU537_12795 [Candidatus Thorarchaeota archaeon]|nr:MAG: hypothetical protein EU537_12795 [Candidatus Thorarchaeota archaeon]
MNEFAILVNRLTQSGTTVGASIDDLLDALALPEVYGRHVLFNQLAKLHELLQPFGFIIRHNPLTHTFYMETHEAAQEGEQDSHLPDRLAATLLVVITLTYQEGDWISIDRTTKFRKKSQRSVMADLRELTDMGYIELDKNGGRVRPGQKVAFEIDYDEFFRELTEEKE